MVESYCQSKGLECRQPFPGFYVIDKFDEHIKLSSKTLLKELDERVPSRGSGDEIVPGQLQWVQGSNRNLMFRGNELNRRKIWAQNGSVEDGVRIYVYTGFAYPVAEATSDWNDDETFKNASEGMNTFMNEIEAPEMNHLIVTAYDNGDSNIGMHYVRYRVSNLLEPILELMGQIYDCEDGIRRKVYGCGRFDPVCAHGVRNTKGHGPWCVSRLTG